MAGKTIEEEFTDAGINSISKQGDITVDIKKICKDLGKMSYGFGNLLVKILYNQAHHNIIDYMHTLKLYYGKNRLTDREFASLAKVVFPHVEFTKANIERYGNYEHYYPDMEDYEEIPCPF